MECKREKNKNKSKQREKEKKKVKKKECTSLSIQQPQDPVEIKQALKAIESAAGRLIGGIGGAGGRGRERGVVRGGAAAVVEVLGVAGGVVAERDGPGGGARRGRRAADAPRLLRQAPEQPPPRPVAAPARGGADVAHHELQAPDHRGAASPACAAGAGAGAGQRRPRRGKAA
uniref:Uncharacterized protein n=1 Tax=Oryza punctata TaxID=4537 RepID=A0A0E0JNR7_ORYPU